MSPAVTRSMTRAIPVTQETPEVIRHDDTGYSSIKDISAEHDGDPDDITHVDPDDTTVDDPDDIKPEKSQDWEPPLYPWLVGTLNQANKTVNILNNFRMHSKLRLFIHANRMSVLSDMTFPTQQQSVLYC